MNEIKERLRKLRELALRGHEGEAANAQSLLEKLLAKHDMTMADISDDVTSWIKLRYQSPDERKLLIQMIAKVTDDLGFSYKQNARSRLCYFNLTKAQEIQAKEEWAVYLKDYRKQKERLYDAFVQSNRIYPASDDGSSAAEREYTEEEIKEIEAMLRMAQGIEKSEINKLLEC